MLGADQGRSSRDWSRRDLGRAVVGAASVAWLGGAEGVLGVEAAGESLLGRFHRSLSPDQRRALVFPFDDPKRIMVQNHWAVVPGTIASLTLDQQELALALIRQVCTPDGFERLTRQRTDDAGGWKHDHIAVFGSPDDPGRFEWVLTGRHLTLRGSSLGSISGGPLFWGHSVAGPASIGHVQAGCAGDLFRSLDPEQREQALKSGEGQALAGIGRDQQAIARRLIAALGEPFRAFDVASVRGGGLEGSRWQAFRTPGDKPDDSPRIWRLTGPGFSWSYHADPHLHSWFDSVAAV